MIKILLVIIIYNSFVIAEDGLVYIGDLNKDGIDDKIVSGPQGMFGAQGQNGPFTLMLSLKGKFKYLDIGGSGYWVVERSKDWIRLWDYAHMSSSSGNISYTEINLIDGSLNKGGSILINPGDGGAELGNLILDAIFNNKKLERCECAIVHNYTPPEFNAEGKEWGK